MELESNQYEKCLEILPANSEQDSVKEIPSYAYSEAEIQHLSVLNLESWKGISLVNIPPMPLISATQNVSSDVKGQVKKRPREEAIEYAAKALYELSSLRDLAKMAIKTDQQVIQPNFRKTTTCITSVSIPFQQRMAVMTSRFSSAQKSLQTALSVCEGATQDHAIVIEKIKTLGKYWKLHTSTSGAVSRDASILSSIGTQLSVDCSLICYGDHPSTLVEYLVPLLIDKTRLVLPSNELSRHVSTLAFELFHSNFGMISSMTAWDIANGQGERSMSSEMEDDLVIVDEYCRKRQHDALCSRLFGRLRFNALDFKSNWILSGHRPLNTPNQIIDSIINALYNDNMMKSIEIWSLERGSLHLALSNDLSIRISLVPINTDANFSSMDIDTHAPESAFTSCIMQAYKLARSYLFHHFSQSMDESSSSTSTGGTNSIAPTTATATSSKQSVQAYANTSSINLLLDRAVSVDLKTVKPIIRDSSTNNNGSVLEAFLNSLKARILKLLLESACSNKAWDMHSVRDITSANTQKILSALSIQEDDKDYKLDEFHYEMGFRQKYDKINKVSLRVDSRGYHLKVFSTMNSSGAANTLLRDFTSIKSLLHYLDFSLSQ